MNITKLFSEKTLIIGIYILLRELYLYFILYNSVIIVILTIMYVVPPITTVVLVF